MCLSCKIRCGDVSGLDLGKTTEQNEQNEGSEEETRAPYPDRRLRGELYECWRVVETLAASEPSTPPSPFSLIFKRFEIFKILVFGANGEKFAVPIA